MRADRFVRVKSRQTLGEADVVQSYIDAGILDTSAPNVSDMQLAQSIARELARAYSYTAPTAIPVPNPYERIKQQLLTVNTILKRQFGVDPEGSAWVTDQLAQMLVGMGLTNLLDIGAYNGDNISFWYDKRRGNVLALNLKAAGTIAVDRFGALPVRFGRQKYWLYLKFTGDGIPVFVVPAPEDIGSDWVDFRTGALFVASGVLMAIPGVGQAIGEFVMGAQLAATYPAIATAIGNAAMSTALNGGDVQAGVTSAVAGMLGAQAGGLAQAQTSSTIVGNVTAAVTKTLIAGGDVEKAVGQSLLQSGATSLGNLLEPSTMDTGDEGFFSNYNPDFGVDVGTIPDDFAAYDFGDGTDLSAGDINFGGGAVTAMPDLSGDLANVDLTGGAPVDDFFTDEYGVQYGIDAQGDLTVIDYVDDQGVGYYTDADGNVLVADTATTADLGQTFGVPVYDPAQSGPTGPSGSVNTANGQALTNLALAALKLVGAWNQAGQPAIRGSSQTATANANGTVTTRNPNGTVTTTRAPVGTPYLTANGSLVTNNGDGSYTTITPNGQTITGHYPGTGASGSGALGSIPPAVLYGGLGLLALLALKK